MTAEPGAELVADSGHPEDTDASQWSRAPRRSRGWITLAVAAGWFVLIALWTLATPNWASPDEPSHGFRAYSAAHGEVYVPPAAAMNGGGGWVTVPKGLNRSQSKISCFAFRAQVPAGCAITSGTDDSRPVRAASGAARYDPAYYVAVGLPSLFSGTGHALLAMRLASAALSAWMLAWALTSASLFRRPRLAVAATLFAVTPSTLFLAAVVNPNGLEITSAAAVWVSGLLLAGTDDPGVRRLALRRTGIAAMVLVVQRGLSPLWLAVIAVIVLVGVPGAVRRLFRRDVRWWAAGVTATTAAALAWTVLSHSLDVTGSGPPQQLSLTARLADAYHRQIPMWTGFLGSFGWLDTSMSTTINRSWLYVSMAVLLVTLVCVSWRMRAALVLALGASTVLPILIEAHEWNVAGPVWQVRYTLPVAIGLPLLAGAGLSVARRLPVLLEWVLTAVFAVVAAAVGVLGFVYALHRNVDGVGRSFTFSGRWQPPLGSWTLLGLEAAAVGLATLAAVAFARRLRPARS